MKEAPGPAGPAAGPGRRAGVAAFDFDGTLVAGDSLMPFLATLLGRRRAASVVAGAGPAMARAYRRSGRDGAKAVLLGRALAGLPAARVAAAGAGFGADLAVRIRPPMARRLAWHRDQGHRVLVVSASLAAYLEPFGERAGIDEVIATRLEEGPGGTLTGRLLGPNVRGPEKAARLAAAVATWSGRSAVELWAYGNSAGDRQMLAMADHPLLVGRRWPAPA
ncbi:MAG: HAD-IB family hydrolase [Acidimicrobiales bacterium]